MMFRTLILAALLGCLPLAARAEGNLLTPFKAGYEGSVSVGSLVCEMTLTHDADGSYTLQSSSHAVGLAALFARDVITETSRFEVVDGRPRPLEYRYTRSGGRHEKSETIHFDWSKDTARTEENGQEKSTPLTPGVTDRFLLQLVLGMDAANGKLHGEYQVLDHHEIASFTPPALEDEPIHVPHGHYATLLAERQDKGSKRVTDFWLAPKLHYLPVQIQQREPGEDTYTLELASISFDTPVPADSTAQR